MKRSCLGYSKLHTFLNFSFLTLTLIWCICFQKAKISMKTWTQNSRGKRVSLTTYNSFRWPEGGEETTSSRSFVVFPSCIIFVFPRQFTNGWILLYIHTQMQKQYTCEESDAFPFCKSFWYSTGRPKQHVWEAVPALILNMLHVYLKVTFVRIFHIQQNSFLSTDSQCSTSLHLDSWLKCYF